MAEDNKTIAKAITEYCDTEDDFKAEKLKLNGELNKRKDEALGKIVARVARLNIMKESFLATCKQQGHIRRGLNVFDDIEQKDDLDLAAGYARATLASGMMFEPLYDEKMKAHLERIVEEAADEEGSDNVVAMSDAAE